MSVRARAHWVATWLALLAALLPAVIPTLSRVAHAQAGSGGLQVAMCSGGGLRWVTISADGALADATAPAGLPATGTDDVCPYCLSSASTAAPPPDCQAVLAGVTRRHEAAAPYRAPFVDSLRRLGGDPRGPPSLI
ncbi:MAG: DUF2946 family protein [Nevskiales bacterium]|nr:DUF2946 family protein [Nevskiales bacterium]